MADAAYLEKIQNWDAYIDVELTEEENLILQINSDNLTELTLDDIEFSIPSVIDELVIPYDHPNNPIELNTKVVLKAKTTSKYNGEDIYKYRRINIVDQWNILNDSKPITIPKSLVSDSDIKNYLFSRMTYRKESFTIERRIDGKNEYIKLKPIPDSLLYIGEFEVPYTDKDGPIGKINRANPIQGLDYYFKEGSIKLEGLDYYTDVINSKGFTYGKGVNYTIVNSQGFTYKEALPKVINSKGFTYP